MGSSAGKLLGLFRAGNSPVLASSGVTSSPNADQPFILMVEAASIDKQSHPNNAAGTIWDTLELDKSVGVARKFLANRKNPDTLDRTYRFRPRVLALSCSPAPWTRPT